MRPILSLAALSLLAGLAAPALAQLDQRADLPTDMRGVLMDAPVSLEMPSSEIPALAYTDVRNDARASAGGWLDDGGSPSTSAPRRAPAGSRAVRSTYLAYQTALSTYVYGVGLPLGLGVEEPRILIATPLIAAPLMFGAHLWSSSRLDITESHLKASMYIPTAAVYSATSLSLAFSPDAGDGYKVGSLIGAGAYPLGLWYAHKLGDDYRSDPDQLDSKMLFAMGYGFLGLVTPILYFERPSQNSEEILRIGLGQSVGMAAVGHVIADYYAPNASTTGVKLGMATHAVLGGATGVAVAAFSDASMSFRPWLGSAIIGSTLGFTEGVFFFRDSRDTPERSQYSALGALGGSMMGLGLQILFYDSDASSHAKKISWSSFLVGGALAGYAATYALTGNMVENASIQKPRDPGAVEPSRWSFNPVPQREAVMSRGEPSLRWKVPGVAFTF